MHKLLISVLLLSNAFFASCLAQKSLDFKEFVVQDSIIMKGINTNTDEAPRAVFEVTISLPTGDDEESIWLTKWTALQLMRLNDSLPATPVHTASLYAKNQSMFALSLKPNEIAKARAKAFFNEYREEYNEEYPNDSYENRTFKPIFSTPSILTMKEESSYYNGGVHGSQSINYYVFDRENKRELLFNDIIMKSKEQQVRKLLIKGLMNYFEVNTFGELNNYLFVESEQSNYTSFPLPLSSIAITKDGIIFVYQEYEIACYAAGIIQVTIPYSSIMACLKPNVAKSISEIISF